jgi:hypothetical protein
LKEIRFCVVALSFRPNPSIKMDGTDRCGILVYAGITTTDICLLLVAPARHPDYYLTRPFQYKVAFCKV